MGTQSLSSGSVASPAAITPRELLGIRLVAVFPTILVVGAALTFTAQACLVAPAPTPSVECRIFQIISLTSILLFGAASVLFWFLGPRMIVWMRSQRAAPRNDTP